MLFRPLLLTALCAQEAIGLGWSLIETRRREREAQQASSIERRDVDPTKLYKEHNLSVPIDHFHNDSMYEPHSNSKFNLRYWFDDSFYKPGGPVFVLTGGETDASTRLAYLQKGIVHQVIKATGGMGMILEHRYYGKSQPFGDLSVPHLRFLTTDQSLADTAYLAQNIKFPGHENKNLTSHTTPWIAYGGSYAGAYVAFLRKLYPDVYFGAISSSGVTEAIYDYWRYYEPIRKFGPKQCIETTQNLTNVMDNIFLDPKNMVMRPVLKQAFGLENVTFNDDFMSALNIYGIGGWQSKNWDPEVNVPAVTEYCNQISNDSLVYPAQASKRATVQKLLAAGGYGSPAQMKVLTNRMLNWIGNANVNIVKSCAQGKQTQDECLGTHNASVYQEQSLDRSEYRSWPWQFCNQWGFYQTGSGVPKDQLPLVSRLVTLDYSTIICRDSFNIYNPPDVNAVNKNGGYNISYPRLAIVDGQWDPWREACPHSSLARSRKSTSQEPFYEISASVHHWDENGIFPNETTKKLPPKRISKIQSLEVSWVKGWLKDADNTLAAMRQQRIA